jgi:hypothetical protein
MTTIRTLLAAALVAGSATMAFSAEGVSTYNIGHASMIEGRNSAEFTLPKGDNDAGVHAFNATAGRAVIEGRNSADLQAPASEVNIQR